MRIFIFSILCLLLTSPNSTQANPEIDADNGAIGLRMELKALIKYGLKKREAARRDSHEKELRELLTFEEKNHELFKMALVLRYDDKFKAKHPDAFPLEEKIPELCTQLFSIPVKTFWPMDKFIAKRCRSWGWSPNKKLAFKDHPTPDTFESDKLDQMISEGTLFKYVDAKANKFHPDGTIIPSGFAERNRKVALFNIEFGLGSPGKAIPIQCSRYFQDFDGSKDEYYQKTFQDCLDWGWISPKKK